MEEKDFLANVARALGRNAPLTKRPDRDKIGPPQFWKEQKFENDAPFEMFKNNLEGLTGRVSLVKDSREATNQIRLWLKTVNAKSVIMWDHEDLKRYVKTDDLGVQVVFWNQDKDSRQLIETAEKADVGITWANYAIGYTGTLALYNAANQGRSVSLLPPTHIAVFKRSMIVPTMSYVMRDLLERRGSGNLPSTVDFITGPSRTSDIEMDLSIGVHGPFRVWAIVIDE